MECYYIDKCQSGFNFELINLHEWFMWYYMFQPERIKLGLSRTKETGKSMVPFHRICLIELYCTTKIRIAVYEYIAYSKWFVYCTKFCPE